MTDLSHTPPRRRRRLLTADGLLSAYTWAFLVFMFLPLLLMILSSFNDTSPPSVTEWQGFTTKWYAFFWMPEEALRADPVLRALDRGRFVSCFGNSLYVAAMAVPLSPLLRLAEGALLHTFLSRREQGR